MSAVVAILGLIILLAFFVWCVFDAGIDVGYSRCGEHHPAPEDTETP